VRSADAQVAIGVLPRRINEIVHGKRRISADTALRLARYLGTTERFWLDLQGRYDVEVERDRLSTATLNALCQGIVRGEL
jgi:addiction module HigA family antidote